MALHVTERLQQRGIPATDADLITRAKSCNTDTAIVLYRGQNGRCSDGSNGDLVILIVRHGWPVTVMFRRSNQPLTCDALRVNKIIE